MSSRIRAFSSSVGMKLLIGPTGLALFLCLVIHIAENLMVFFGPVAFNKHAHSLEDNPLIPVVEIGLSLIFLIQVHNAGRNFLANRRARQVSYVQKGTPDHPAARRSRLPR